MLQCFLFTKLKKRLANVIPSKRPQGKVPTRSNKRVKLLVSTVYESRQQKEVSIDETLYLYLYTVTWGNLYGN